MCLIALLGCSPSVIGPFVKTVTRTGDTLAIISCEVVLQGGDLSEGRCYSQVVPLAGTPVPPGIDEPSTAAPASPLTAAPDPLSPAGSLNMSSTRHFLRCAVAAIGVMVLCAHARAVLARQARWWRRLPRSTPTARSACGSIRSSPWASSSRRKSSLSTVTRAIKLDSGCSPARFTRISLGSAGVVQGFSLDLVGGKF